MKRRIILLVGSFAVLLAAFLIYRLATWSSTQVDGSPFPPAEHGDGALRNRPPGTIPERGTGVFYARRDVQGRLEGEYKAKEWKKTGDYTYHLIEPEVTIYRKDGQRVYVRGDTGNVVLDVQGKNKPRRATLSGRVKADIDRGAGPGLGPLTERLKDRMTILMDEVEFDSETLMIRTAGDVEVRSAEADIFGRGLFITWKEAPTELKKLRIERGNRMVLKEIPEPLVVVSPLAGTTAPVKPGAGQTTQPVAPGEPAAVPGEIAEQAIPTDVEQAQNIYRIEFSENVRAVSADRSLKGADRLAVTMEWQGPAKRGKKAPPEAPPPTGLPAAPSGPVKAPASARKTTDNSRVPPAPPPAANTMTIEWTGPLVVTPVGYAARPSQKRYKVEAEGDKLTLADSQAVATCKSFLFKSDEAPDSTRPSQQGMLAGTKVEPATLAMADGSTAVCEKMRFDRLAGKAYLDGPGEMTRLTDRPSDKAAAAPRPAATTQPADKLDRITWQERVDLRFGEETVRLKDGSTRSRPYIDQADFFGKVALRQAKQAPDKEAGFVNCDKLAASLARTADGRTYMKRAVATGNVTGRQEEGDIQADSAVLTFEETPRKTDRTRSRTLADASPRPIRPATLEAQGHVKITLKKKDQPLTAEADRFKSNLADRSAILYGSAAGPAHVSQGPNELFGDEIHRYEVADAAGRKDTEVRVNSPGRLHFLTQQDLDSRKLDKPRKISISWSRSMNYQGHRNVGEFFGDVKLDSAEDHMTCGVMRVRFENVEPATRPSATSKPKPPVPEARGGDLALGMEQYSRKTIRMITADEDVLVLRQLEDAEQRLLRRQQLRGEHLVYDVPAKRILCHGPGGLVAEDYEPRKPTTGPPAKGADEFGSAAADWPSQTVLEWHNAMDYSQELRQVVIDGDVSMAHRSGDKIVLKEMLKVPDWGPLKEGRRTDLRADRLMVEFAEPPKGAGKAQDGASGPRLGPMKQFSATRGVNIIDGPRRVLAQRVIYDKATDTVAMWGFLEGQRPDNAHVDYVDPKTGVPQSLESPKILWFRKNDRIIAEKITGGGGR